jgi:hypothetical protein
MANTHPLLSPLIHPEPFHQLALWNANGLPQHALELQSFLTSRNIGIMLLSETHFTLKSYLRIPHYTIYRTNHPAGTARGGTAIVFKNVIKHHPLEPRLPSALPQLVE